MHICKFIQRIIICSKDCMNIFDHGSKFGGFLEKIFTRTPHISILHCLKICQKITFCQQFINSRKFTVDSTVIDDIVRIFCFGIKLFHLHIHGRQSVITFSCIFGNIFAACQLDHV